MSLILRVTNSKNTQPLSGKGKKIEKEIEQITQVEKGMKDFRPTREIKSYIKDWSKMMLEEIEMFFQVPLDV
jgi:hypothetical protein